MAPTERWMQQVARIVIMAAVGFLKGCCYLVHDRDTKFGSGFERILASAEWNHCVYPGRGAEILLPAARMGWQFFWAPDGTDFKTSVIPD